MSTTIDPNERLLGALRRAADKRAFTLRGPSKLYAHQGLAENGAPMGGKTVNFNGGIDLLFKGVRPGKRSPFIFEFEQMDEDEYAVIDIESKKVDQLLPKLSGYLFEVISRAGGFEDEFTGGWTLQNYVDRFIERAREIAEQEEAERIAEAAVVQSERYQDNDAWGQW